MYDCEDPTGDQGKTTHQNQVELTQGRALFVSSSTAKGRTLNAQDIEQNPVKDIASVVTKLALD